MKLVKTVLLAAALLGAVAPGPAEARGRGGFGLGLGLGLLISAPLYAYPYYYRPYYYPPYGYDPYYGYAPGYGAPYVQQPSYVQQSPAPVQQQQPSYSWYYCPSLRGYYPYVKQCPEAWQPVSPTPPGL